MEGYILETQQLVKKYGKQLAVDHIDLKIPRNRVYGLLGPNGAGKSTTLKMVTGLIRPTSGTILFNGAKWQRKDLGQIGALIEEPALYPNLTAKENLEIHRIILNLPKARIEEVLDIVNLQDTGKKKVSQFSLGMKQRLGIAVALIHSPKLLILDEPTNGLDPMGIQEMRDLVKDFTHNGITVILSSHILSEVELMADYIGIINEGKLCYQDHLNKTEDLEGLFMEIIKKSKKGERRHD